MSAYRDLCHPTGAHVVTLDRVRLEFNDDGLLRSPDSYQLETMTKTPLRRERFIEIAEPAPSPTVATAAAAATTRETTLPTTSAGAAEAASETSGGDDASRKGPRKPRQGSDA